MKGTAAVLAGALVFFVLTRPIQVSAPVTDSSTYPAQTIELPRESFPQDPPPEATPPQPVDELPFPENVPEDAQDDTPVAAVAEPDPPPFYTSTPLPLDEVNMRARLSLVNILCIGTPPLKSTSGTGILINDTGMVLTNAHIGQHVLLADSGAPVTCAARIGSPATTVLSVSTVFLPPHWAAKHADLILASGATGTGESDFALLQLESLPAALRPLPLESRHNNPFEGVHTLAAYPAEFIATTDVQRSLHALSTSVRVRDVYTFSDDTADVISLGANPLAQQGASGGAVVNPWGYLVAIITTTTVGVTTGERDLRAITIGHIFRELNLTGIQPEALFSREPSALTEAASQTASSAKILLQAIE